MAKDFDAVRDALREIMVTNAEGLRLTDDAKGDLTVEDPEPDAKGKHFWLGAVQKKKSYVSYHLMPVYMNPSLLDDITPELKARMQGKSCFNFTAVDDDLFEQLGQLTAAGMADYRS